MEFLCPPGLISSGFLHRNVSSPDFLHFSFRKILLEERNLEQSFMVQRVHALWWLDLTDDKSSSILYPIRDHCGAILMHRIFGLHFKYT